MKTICRQLNIKEFPFEIKDSNNNVIYYEDSNGYWYKQEYDSSNNVIYFENSNELIIDNRPKHVELTLEEIAEKFNINVNDLKIKK